MNKIVELVGNTYPVREKLKTLGARWNAAKKCWTIVSDKADAARAIVSGTVSPATEKALPIENSLPWSDEQNAIFAWFATGSGNLLVQARAGTGKTTTIKQAFSHAPESGRLLYAVFNKKNQREAQEKITDGRVEVRTLHSLGFLFIKKTWPASQPDDFVESARLDLVSPGLPEEVSAAVIKLVGFCKNLTVGLPDINEILSIGDARNISVSDEMEKDFPPARVAELARSVMKESFEKDVMNRVSFNDMVWLPVAAGWVKPMFDLVVVDESQDMNMPQLMMAERASKGRICVVGDDRQAIYGFRGAATDGMHLMKQRLNAAQLGLTVTYRCPKSVVAVAAQIVPDYSAAPSAPEGEILDMSLTEAVNGLVVGDAVLSRLNAPLMGIALRLLRDGTPARIEGRDIGKQLVGMVRKLRAKSVPDFLKKLDAWSRKQTDRAIAAGGKNMQSKCETIADQRATLVAVSENCANVSDIENKITSLFEDSDSAKRPAVVCSSVHKAKGLEWNKVCLVEDTFKNRTSGGEESNIYYVAVTRAKKTLVRAVGTSEK